MNFTKEELNISSMMEVRQIMGGRWAVMHSSNDAIISYASSKENAEAKLSLAKAAPELLANLKRMVNNYPDAYANEAIKKATL